MKYAYIAQSSSDRSQMPPEVTEILTHTMSTSALCLDEYEVSYGSDVPQPPAGTHSILLESPVDGELGTDVWQPAARGWCFNPLTRSARYNTNLIVGTWEDDIE